MKKRGKLDLKTRALREELAKAQRAAESSSWRATSLMGLAKDKDAEIACLKADLSQVERRLRAICRHSLAIKCDGEVSKHTHRVRPPVSSDYSPTRAFERHYEPMDLAQLIFWAETNPHRFGRYLHFTIRDFKRPDISRAYAVSEDALEMFRNAEAGSLVEYIAEEFGLSLHETLLARHG
jgi:hypothetical protein